MSLEQAILEAVRLLPAEKQQEILSHANRLRDETTDKKPSRIVKGLWADLGISLSAEEIGENQRKMWKTSPRKIFDTHAAPLKGLERWFPDGTQSSILRGCAAK